MLLLNEEIHKEVIRKRVPRAERFVWIATADIKDMHVEEGKRFVPYLQVLAKLVARGVEIRLIHAKEPGPLFRKDFDRFPELLDSDRFERLICPRMHMKCVLVDGNYAFVGSPNLTGAGLGAKHPDRRNFEAGIATEDPAQIQSLLNFFDRLYLGEFCRTCRLREICPDPIV